jgi:acetylornithine deacetylase/succinyl-diaminopimelate desuccinylase-like protein
METWIQYIEKHQQRFLKELIELLKVPSISSKSENKPDMQRCAVLIDQEFKAAGADTVTIYQTNGHPIVYAEKIADKSKPTVFVYGHYDVQPANPLHLWDSPPFEPVVKDGKI